MDRASAMCVLPLCAEAWTSAQIDHVEQLTAEVVQKVRDNATGADDSLRSDDPALLHSRWQAVTTGKRLKALGRKAPATIDVDHAGMLYGSLLAKLEREYMPVLTVDDIARNFLGSASIDRFDAVAHLGEMAEVSVKFTSSWAKGHMALTHSYLLYRGSERVLRTVSGTMCTLQGLTPFSPKAVLPLETALLLVDTFNSDPYAWSSHNTFVHTGRALSSMSVKPLGPVGQLLDMLGAQLTVKPKDYRHAVLTPTASNDVLWEAALAAA